jgi:hypothetical protein
VQAGGRLVIAIDGKTVRGAKNKAGKAPHLVAALAHGIRAVLGQVAVGEKSNEIPAVRDLLKAFADLASAVITIDAMHTQSDTAQVILGRGAGYVMTVKANMPTLYRQLKKLPWAAVPAVSAMSTGHGRRARRTIKAVLRPAASSSARTPQIHPGLLVVHRPGQCPGHPQDVPCRTGDDLQVHSVPAVLSRVEGPVRGDPVDRDQGAVHDDVGVPGLLRVPDRRAELRDPCGQQGDGLVHVPPGRGGADPEPGRQLGERLAFAQVDQD